MKKRHSAEKKDQALTMLSEHLQLGLPLKDAVDETSKFHHISRSCLYGWHRNAETLKCGHCKKIFSNKHKLAGHRGWCPKPLKGNNKRPVLDVSGPPVASNKARVEFLGNTLIVSAAGYTLTLDNITERERLFAKLVEHS